MMAVPDCGPSVDGSVLVLLEGAEVDAELVREAQALALESGLRLVLLHVAPPVSWRIPGDVLLACRDQLAAERVAIEGWALRRLWSLASDARAVAPPLEPRRRAGPTPPGRQLGTLNED